MKRHWYFISVWECVLCGATRIYRERRYGRKPRDPMKRREFSQGACDGHFL